MKKYENTSQIEPLQKILGQERAISSMEIGLRIDNPAYNIYVAGNSGTGKSTYTLKALKESADKKDKHKDWCYVYNFEQPREPLAIELEKGMGRVFKKDIEKLIESLLDELRDTFESEDFEIGKNQLLEDYDIEKETLLKKIKKYGEEKGFKLKNSKVGMIFTPINEEDDDLSDEEFYKVKRELENMAIQVVYKIRDLEIQAKEALLDLQEEVGKYIIEPHIDSLMEKYKDYDKVKKYLENLEKDILEYSYLFYLDEDEPQTKEELDNFIKYKVNLFVDNGSDEAQKSAPVILEINPSPGNMFGKVEYDYNNGNVKTDFTKILPGAIHKANGGYLVLYAEQLLRYPLSWDILKRTLQSKKIGVDTQTGIKPESIPIDLKIVLIGSNYIYNILYTYDSDFNKYFKIFVDFDDQMDKNIDNEEGISRFVALQCEKNDLKHFTYDAVEEVIKYSARITGDEFKLSTEFNKLMEIVVEGDAYAQINNHEYVEKEDVKQAIEERRYRFGKIESKIDESVDIGYTLLDTEGERIGVINALSVLNIGEYSFGKPSRVTVTTSQGSVGIVNIEREVKMSGPIHNKGVLILEGFLSEKFAQEYPLSMNAYICFEQNYGGIDGDSASGAELCTIISSLAEVPIKQNIAMTGSVNQKGEIQVVGGICEKVEGFYFTCKKKGFKGGESVIIPKNNNRNLVLDDEVKEAIKENKFRIYEVDKIEEALEILTGLEIDSIYKKVTQKLDKYNNNKDQVK